MQLRNKYKLIVPVFFIVFLCLGAVIFKDYGISRDERAQRGIGGIALKYVFLGDKSLNNFPDKDYGPVFEMLLGALEVSLRLTDNPRATYLMRHAVTFLLFYIAVFLFYRLSRYRFQSYGIGLLGSLFLILSPRIFADAFYNSKDIAFLSMFIISIYTLIMFFDMMTLKRAFIHAFACAVTIDIRIAGVLIPLLAVIFFIAHILMTRPLQKKSITSFAQYMFFLCFFVILFWPTLWQNPLHNFANAFLSMFQFSRWQGEVLYLGNHVAGSELPWHYIPVWIIITTPVCYSVFFLIGCVYFIRPFFGRYKYFYSLDRYDLIIMLWFFLPLLAVCIFKPVLYNAWRQLFFIYPAFLLIGLSGLINLFKSIKLKFHGLTYKAVCVGIVLLAGINLINTVKFMVRHHPFQNLYFNFLAGKNMQDIKKRFEFDYWGLSYRKALEYILKNDPGKEIKIYVDDYAGKVNAYILSAKERKRLVYVGGPNQADYFVGNYKLSSDEYQYKNEFYSVKINGAKIISVYKL